MVTGLQVESVKTSQNEIRLKVADEINDMIYTRNDIDREKDEEYSRKI